MNDLFEQYSWMVIEIISGVISLTILFSLFSNHDIIHSIGLEHIDQSSKVAQVEYEIPIVDENDFIVDSAIINQYSLFDWKNYVRYSNKNDHLEDFISVEGSVDTMHVGEYQLIFRLYYNGEMILKEATYYVREA